MTLEALNLIRKGNGQEPLTELPVEFGGAPKEENTEKPEKPEKTAEEIEAERVASEKEKSGKKEEPVVVVGELSDEQLLALLNKKGITVAKLEDLKPKETALDPAAEAEKREAAVLSFGLSKGLFKKSEYDQFVEDKKDLQNLVYASFYDECKAEDKDLSDEDIQAEFLSKYGLDEAQDTRRYKQGVKEIKAIGTSLLKSRYEKVLSAADQFSIHEKDAQSAADNQKKVASELPIYTAAVEEAFSAVKKIPFKFSDDESYDVEMKDEQLNELKSAMLKAEYASGKILSGYDKEVLKQQVFAAVLSRNYLTMTQSVLTQGLKKHSAGTKGVPLSGGTGDKTEVAQLTDAQQKLVELTKQHAGAN